MLLTRLAFVRHEPLGSLSASSTDNEGFIHSDSDQDAIRFYAEAGERIAALIAVEEAVTLTAQLYGDVSISGAVSSAAPGDNVYVAPTLIPADGFYELRLTSDGATRFSADLIRNAALETGAGDSADGAELEIDTTFVDLASGRFAVLGNTSRDYEFVHYNDPSKFIGTTANPLNLGDDEEVSIATTIGNELIPAGVITIGNNGGVMVGLNVNLYFQNLPLPGPGLGTAIFPYWDDLGDDSGNVYVEETTVDGTPALVVTWDDRNHFTPIGEPPSGTITFELQLFDSGSTLARFAYEDVEFGANRPEWNFGNTASIGYQFNDNEALQFSFGGVDIDPENPDLIPDVNVANGDVVEIQYASDVDEYTVDLSSRVGQSIDVLLAGLDGLDLTGATLELLDDTGATQATGTLDPLGVDATNYDLGILGFVVPDIGTNVYTVRVTNNTPGDYSLVVVDAIAFESEPNDSDSDALRNLNGPTEGLGFLDSAGDTDLFEIQASAGQTVELKLETLLDDPDHDPLNDLDPEIEVRASDGTTVIASDLDSLDGKNARLLFTAPANDDYLIYARSTGGTGEYLLSGVTFETDFGDAPDSYPTTLTDDGARHGRDRSDTRRQSRCGNGRTAVPRRGGR